MLLKYAPEILTLLLLAIVFAMIALPTMRIPRHGGKAYEYGYQLTDNPYMHGTRESANWSIEWMGAEITTLNQKA